MTLQTFVLLLPAFVLVLTLDLWLNYLAVCCLKKARDAGRLPEKAEPFAKLIVVVGLIKDAFYNIFVATFLFMDLPQELLLTDRLERYKYGRNIYRLHYTKSSGEKGVWRVMTVWVDADINDWRFKEAIYWGDTFLDPYDPDGIHLKAPATSGLSF